MNVVTQIQVCSSPPVSSLSSISLFVLFSSLSFSWSFSPLYFLPPLLSLILPFCLSWAIKLLASYGVTSDLNYHHLQPCQIIYIHITCAYRPLKWKKMCKLLQTQCLVWLVVFSPTTYLHYALLHVSMYTNQPHIALNRTGWLLETLAEILHALPEITGTCEYIWSYSKRYFKPEHYSHLCIRKIYIYIYIYIYRE